MKRENLPNSTVDSHSSVQNNDRIIALLFEVDRRGLMAQDNLHIRNIEMYFNALEQSYINTQSIIHSAIVNGIEEVRQKYLNLRVNMDLMKGLHTPQTLWTLLFLTKEYNSRLINGLQAVEFFFRLGIKRDHRLDTIGHNKIVFQGKDRGQVTYGKRKRSKAEVKF